MHSQSQIQGSNGSWPEKTAWGVGCSQAGQHRGSTSSTTVGEAAVTPQPPPGVLRESWTPPGGDLRGTVKGHVALGFATTTTTLNDTPLQPVPLNLLCPLGPPIAPTPNTRGELQHTPIPLMSTHGTPECGT